MSPPAPPTTADPTPAAQTPQHVSLATQLRVMAALGVSGLIFWTVGWGALQPADAGSPITLFHAPHPLTAFVVLAALAAVTGGLAVIIAGRAPKLMAPAAVGAGLAGLNLRGAEADYLGAYVLSAGPNGPVWPTMLLITELWAWLALVAIGAYVGQWVAGRVLASDPLSAGLESAQTVSLPEQTGKLAASVAVTAALGYTLVRILGGSPADAVLKGQVYFSVGVGMLLATWGCQWAFRCVLAWWPLLAVGLLGMAAYVIGQPARGPASVEFMLRVMPDMVSRPLPIEYAGLGALGGVAGLYLSNQHLGAAPEGSA